MIISIPENFKWSFSKLSTFETCPLSFQLQYLEYPKLEQQQNAWAEYGILCHSLLESYAKKELTSQQLSGEFKRRYPEEVIHSFPPWPKGYAEKAFQQGVDYFDQFTGFGEQYEVVSSEEFFSIHIGKYPFVGILDLVLKDKDTESLIVIDHKTKSESSMMKEIETYRKQLYIYAAHVKNRYGCFPESIQFNMIKSIEPIIEVFNAEKYNETLLWAEDTIDIIMMEEEWKANPNAYYCRYICPVFQHCDIGMEFCKYKTNKNRS